MSSVFFTQKINFAPPFPLLLEKWLQEVARRHGRSIKELHYIICDDAFLHELNKRYLGHDSWTDIVTFDHSESKGKIEGDCYISIPRVIENATLWKVPFSQEWHRVILHGLLHLLGYKDDDPKTRKRMRFAENRALDHPILKPLWKVRHLVKNE